MIVVGAAPQLVVYLLPPRSSIFICSPVKWPFIEIEFPFATERIVRGPQHPSDQARQRHEIEDAFEHGCLLSAAI
jgi:hypothetical protein